MIIIEDNIDSWGKPYKVFKSFYDEALIKNQRHIEAACISSFSKPKNEVDSRFVNIKFISNESFIFFSNYSSCKASDFIEHNQIAVNFFWNSIGVQIRLKAQIKKTSKSYNQKYFLSRVKEKNALAISSNQSKPIKAYDNILKNYNNSLKYDDLNKCPDYWGGYSFKPFEIEFWKGHKFRLNKRNLYKKEKNTWSHSILEP